MDTFTLLLSGIAIALHIGAYWHYFEDLMRGRATMDAGSWGIWAAFWTLALYLSISNQIWIGIMISAPAPLMIAAILLFKRKSILRPGWVGLACLAACTILLVPWAQSKPPLSHPLMMLCIACAYVPTLVSVRSGKLTGRATPWFLWAFTGALAAIVFALRDFTLEYLLIGCTSFAANVAIGYAVRKRSRLSAPQAVPAATN